VVNVYRMWPRRQEAKDGTETVADTATTAKKPAITVFHCVNALEGGHSAALRRDDADINIIRMACSSMTRDVYLLRAYEAGADAVVVLVCPERQCRYIDGNVRAAKRVGRVKFLLDEVGLGRERIELYNVKPGDDAAVSGIIDRTLETLKDLGPNPAA
jgi:F420-non-reducing hydrogenase iron-sulfur subunit